MPPAALIGVSLAATAASTAISASGQRKAGRQAQDAANLEAQGLEQQAGQTRAISHRRSEEIGRQADRLLGRQQALLASSGFAADDISSQEVTSETRRITNYERLLALAEGEDQARGLEFQAQQTRLSGARARSAANRASIGTIIGGVGQIAGSLGSSGLFGDKGGGVGKTSGAKGGGVGKTSGDKGGGVGKTSGAKG